MKQTTTVVTTYSTLFTQLTFGKGILEGGPYLTSLLHCQSVSTLGSLITVTAASS